MWADFLSHFQEESEKTAYFENEVGGVVDEQISAPNQIRGTKNAEESKKNTDLDGGSGGTNKIENEEEDENNKNKKKKLGKADIFAQQNEDDILSKK